MPSTEPAESLRHTPLFESHVSHGARMAPFSGWEMLIQYASILREARAVRSHAGVFDVSHMGRVEIEGPGAAAFADRVFSSGISRLKVGAARYGVLCNEDGGIIDDCLIYRLGAQRFLLVPNASNTQVVLEWLSHWAPVPAEARIRDVTTDLAMIALQGPEGAAMLSGMTSLDLAFAEALPDR